MCSQWQGAVAPPVRKINGTRCRAHGRTILVLTQAYTEHRQRHVAVTQASEGSFGAGGRYSARAARWLRLVRIAGAARKRGLLRLARASMCTMYRLSPKLVVVELQQLDFTLLSSGPQTSGSTTGVRPAGLRVIWLTFGAIATSAAPPARPPTGAGPLHVRDKTGQ